MPTFFGLTSNYRASVFSQIHEIVFNGQGGYDYETVYNMPIWLRKFTYQKLVEEYDKRNEAQNKKQPQKSNSTTPSWVQDASRAKKAGKKPSYTVKKN